MGEQPAINIKIRDKSSFSWSVVDLIHRAKGYLYGLEL